MYFTTSKILSSCRCTVPRELNMTKLVCGGGDGSGEGGGGKSGGERGGGDGGE